MFGSSPVKGREIARNPSPSVDRSYHAVSLTHHRHDSITHGDSNVEEHVCSAIVYYILLSLSLHNYMYYYLLSIGTTWC